MENLNEQTTLEKCKSKEQEDTHQPYYVQETYNIPQHNMGFLSEQIDKLNKKARKLGVEPVTMEEIRQYDKTIHQNLGGGRETYTIRYVEVKVTGKAPKFNGWTFIATIEHEKASKNLIKTIPGIELDHKYRNAPPDCHHCNTHRWRKKTYVCRNENEKEIQVGSTCVKDFLGHRSPESIAWQCEMLGRIGEMFYDPDSDEGGYGVPRAAIRIPKKEFFEVAAQAIREHGWVSKSKAYERPDLELTPTVEIVDFLLFPPLRMKSQIDIRPTDARLAYGALQWAEALHPDNAGKFSDYFYNINVLAKDTSIGISEMGLATSIIGVFKNKRDKELLEKGPKKLNEYFGEVKKRYDMELTVKTISGFDGEWGYTTIYKMEDSDRRSFSWFSTSLKVKLEIGETYKVKTTVKDHKEWNGKKETMLTRITVQKEK